MIVINKKPNITHMPFTLDGKKGMYSFSPGQNRIDSRVWAAIKKTAGDKRMQAHYNAFLKPIGGQDQEVDPAKLNADDFIELIGGAMTLELLDQYATVENSRKGGGRKSVIEAIDKQAAQIRDIEEKKAKA
jgi:hypothetical protein